jgi:hypothetical protein
MATKPTYDWTIARVGFVFVGDSMQVTEPET